MRNVSITIKTTDDNDFLIELTKIAVSAKNQEVKEIIDEIILETRRATQPGGIGQAGLSQVGTPRN